ncbi:hypothetical protein COLO4_10297 [Corchorus olitorius]|uniref:F-box domain-containing protein n=1 Tax=Corchorus olitorius TaxID=93759 RepID=A0A1R3K948_9ROSI|nr:hypothetical protein COLO4_10297 [Corchorus olitorius]
MSDCLPMSDYSNLPRELLLEIFLRLPIEDLVKSTAVCKPWNSVIKNPNFISTHLQKSISSTNTNLLLFRLYTWTSEKGARRLEYSLRSNNKALDEYKQLTCPNIDGCRSRVGSLRVAGSYNGLVCLVEDGSYGYGDTFILWNPVIKKAIHLPEPNVTYSSHGPYDAFTGFGFDSKNNDYKLLRYVMLDTNDYEGEVPIEAEVYSLNANCWTSITSIAPKYIPLLGYPRDYGSSFVNGAIHLLAFDRIDPKRSLILAFDVSEQVFNEIPLPDPLSDEYSRPAQLLTYGQSSIAITTKESWPSSIHLWVMKEYGVATSWTKVLTKEAAESVGKVLLFKQDEQVFVVRNDKSIASLDIKTKHYEVLGVQAPEEYLFVDSYVESLVLLDKCCNAGWNVISIHEDDANSTDE